MKIYLAARYIKRVEMQGIADKLSALGHEITSHWLDGSYDGTTPAEIASYAQIDCGDIMEADTCISFTEEPRKTNNRGGRHVEFGMALALGKRCIVVGHRENVFHYLRVVEFYPDVDSLIKALSE